MPERFVVYFELKIMPLVTQSQKYLWELVIVWLNVECSTITGPMGWTIFVSPMGVRLSNSTTHPHGADKMLHAWG